VCSWQQQQLVLVVVALQPLTHLFVDFPVDALWVNQPSKGKQIVHRRLTDILGLLWHVFNLLYRGC
jgi:hypothetical protein